MRPDGADLAAQSEAIVLSMSTRLIAPSVLGPEVERLLPRETGLFIDVVRRVGDDGWRLRTRRGPIVGAVVEHLAEDAADVARSWQVRDRQAEQSSFEAFDSGRVGKLQEDPTDRAAVISRYQRSMERLARLLGQARQDDWEWPSPSPLGGTETLAEAARRWLTHHYVHRQDVLEAMRQPSDPHDDTVRLVVESVLDAMARQGGDLVTAPMVFEVSTAEPGPGNWALRFDDPETVNRDDLELWQELIRWRPEGPPAHRVERGTPDTPRVRVRSDGERFWRAAFGRGADWQVIEVHGDDEGIAAWRELVTALSEATQAAPGARRQKGRPAGRGVRPRGR